MEKISGCLIELIRPLLPPEAGIREWRAGIAMAALAWNLAVLPESDMARRIEHLVEDVAEDDPPLLEELLHLLVVRKLDLYPDDPRLVLSWDVRKVGAGRFHITAMSSLPAPAAEEEWLATRKKGRFP